jgi:hypothetical protein
MGCCEHCEHLLLAADQEREKPRARASAGRENEGLAVVAGKYRNSLSTAHCTIYGIYRLPRY